MTSLSAVVMAHPDRAVSANELSQKIGAPIVWDEEGPPSRDPKRRWRNGRRCWALAEEQGCEWSLVIQDDAIVTQDLIPGLQLALGQFSGEGLVSAYTGTGRPDQTNVRNAIKNAESRGESWLCTGSLNWGVAIVVPTYTIPDMLAWCGLKKNSPKNYDHRIGLYYRDVVGWRTWHTFPSLVDHPVEGSLIGNEGKRVAHNFLGENVSASDVDWSRTPKEGLPLTVPNRLRKRSVTR